ncbi:MAG: hypothetical protein HC945_02355, partial [Nitrosarchaeum sp.]|nr:hypothetical protein [Nitrosarchaeum sp.]
MALSNIYAEFTQEVDALLKQIMQLPCSPDGYLSPQAREIFAHLEAIATSDRYQGIQDDVSNSAYFQTKFQTLRAAFETYETLLETQEFIKALQADHVLQTEQLRRTFEFAKIEGTRAEITKNSQVLFVGSGPYPETALAIHHIFGCPITCLDINPVACGLSSYLMRKNRIPIVVLQGNGTTFRYQGYTHIIVAALAKPKRDILRQICQSTDHGVTVIVRTIQGLRTMIYEP